MKESGKKTRLRGMENTNMWKERCTKDSGVETNRMGKAKRNGLMVVGIKENMSMELNRVKENSTGQTNLII